MLLLKHSYVDTCSYQSSSYGVNNNCTTTVVVPSPSNSPNQQEFMIPIQQQSNRFSQDQENNCK